MPRSFGTLSLVDTLRSIDSTNINEYGLDNLYADVDLLLQAHNAITADIYGEFGETTQDKIRRYGNTVGVAGFQELDEWGIADAQKTSISGTDVGFPLRRFGRATQWTRLYFDTKTPADFIKETTQILIDDVLNIQTQMRRALFTSTNNLTYIDRLDNKVTLPVRALLNADGAAIPPDRYGNSFNGATHTHYLATASLVSANVDAALDTLIEHNIDGGDRLFIYINRAQEAAFTALSGFLYYERSTIQRGGGYTGNVLTQGQRDDVTPDDVAIGMWDGYAEVWIKPWVPSTYILFFVRSAEGVLTIRTPRFFDGSLRLAYDHEHHPLTANMWERFLGVGVWQRHKAAVLFTGGAAYANPTLSYP
jgi:hypothetical protein